MNDTVMRILPLAGQGFCCAQILVLLALEHQGRENPDLTRSVGGLCHGLGKTGQTCGALLGGCCVLGLYTGQGEPGETPHPEAQDMIRELTEWFTEYTREFGGVTCGKILEKTGGEPDMTLCGDLVGSTFDRVLDILESRSIDPALGKDEQ
jgi:C_GCAxxG_C_C family probable redox protein